MTAIDETPRLTRLQEKYKNVKQQIAAGQKSYMADDDIKQLKKLRLHYKEQIQNISDQKWSKKEPLFRHLFDLAPK